MLAVAILLTVTLVGFDPVVALVLLGSACGLLVGFVRLKPRLYPLPFTLALTCFVGAFLLSLLHDPVRNWALRLIAGMVFFYLLTIYVDTTKRARRLFFFTLAGTAVASLSALLALLEGWSLEPLFFPVDESARFAGLYNATVLAIFTAILVIWLADETYEPKLWKGGFILKLAAIGVLIFQLLSTLTRSAWLGLFIGLSLYLLLALYSSKLARKLWIVTASITISGVVVLYIVYSDSAEPVRQRIYVDSLNPSKDEQKRGGFYFTRNAIDVAMAHPLGVGVGNTQKYTETFNDFEVGAHNTFIMVLSDMGWLAFFGFSLVQIIILRRLFALAARSVVRYGISARMLFCGYSCVLVAGMFQDLLYYMPMWLIPGISAAVLFGREKRTQPVLPALL